MREAMGSEAEEKTLGYERKREAEDATSDHLLSTHGGRVDPVDVVLRSLDAVARATKERVPQARLLAVVCRDLPALTAKRDRAKSQCV